MLKVTPLKRIYHPKGDVYHALKASEASFSEFGEAYFTTILQGDTKGWKKHTKMIMNLIVPIGDVSFYVYDEDSSVLKHHRVNEKNNVRLTIAAGYWVAFKGHGEKNLILNIASIEHDPEEAINLPLEAFSFRGCE